MKMDKRLSAAGELCPSDPQPGAVPLDPRYKLTHRARRGPLPSQINPMHESGQYAFSFGELYHSYPCTRGSAPRPPL